MERIVFFGNGPVAAASLSFLIKNFNVEAVITKPVPAHHKGIIPVLDVIKDINVPNYTVSSKSELSALITEKKFTSKIGVIVDFGLIVSSDVIDYFEKGIVNSHFSLLPEWRGADPITFSILSGQKTTGVSLMKLVEALDEGDLLAQESIDISPQETTATLTDKLVDLSNAILLSTLPKYLNNEISPYPQDTSKPATYSRKISKEESLIDWSKPAIQIERQIRAFQPWPKSHATIAQKPVVITKAHVDPQVTDKPIGIYKSTDKQLVAVTGDGLLFIDELIPAGKKQMTGNAFIAGHNQLIDLL